MENNVKTKICGITNTEDALLAASLGVWALGFIFYKKSPRFVSPSKAQRIIQILPPFVTPVGVFVDQKEGAVRDIAEFCGLNTLQFHGDETPQYCQRFKSYKVIKAFRVHDKFDISGLSQYPVCAYLFDAHQENVYGGSGKTFNWEIIAGKKLSKPVILSGGLCAENIAAAITTVKPYAVDVSSGVESVPGKKDEKLLVEFLVKARAGV
ncbi:MAG TPA: phosphoribosylanthranilate isomerase [Candidatus Omnitrophota bacterium]|nr:phosphoribosylanthranilate isomerase [Candidatus Omnitrophota bacterium]HPD85041.1 phosphoribosylanthranilate isomerase [Candidatus Omnitrophota bacterium]HRZ03899.1 phosphoribosylanthranilate isomerase [Candidatus Omnitrophota bacterium]